MIKSCVDCPRLCRKERNSKKGKGYCGLPDKIYLAHYGLHFFEEPCISYKNGSGTIFFSGCNLKCEYCQNYKISQKVCGKPFTTKEFISIIKELENMGAENINLVSPSPYYRQIIKALKIYKPSIPVVYNTHGYELPRVIKKLLPYVDIFLTDFKYSNDIYSNFSKCPKYKDYALESLKLMLSKKIIFKDDKMVSGVIVRHLVLPGCVENSLKVLDILKELNVPYVSIMSQFTPISEKGYLNRKITQREYNKVLNKVFECNLNGYIQDLSSAKEEYVPKFSLIEK